MARAPRERAGGPPAAIGRAGGELLLRSATLAAAAVRVRRARDPEAVHDLRVAARRLEVALRVWGPADGEAGAREARRARRSARRLRRAAGEAREREVHVALLEGRLLPASGRARSALRPLLASLRGRRDRSRADVAALAAPPRLERIADRVAAVVAAVTETPERIAAAERRVRAARAAAAARLLAAAGTTRDGRLHAARIAVKKWRYAEESRAAVRPAGPEPPLDGLREAQQALGAVHDHATLRALLRRLARRAARAGEPDRSRALAALLPRLERARAKLLAGLGGRLRALAGSAKR